jgi:hypothetical protein
MALFGPDKPKGYLGARKQAGRAAKEYGQRGVEGIGQEWGGMGDVMREEYLKRIRGEGPSPAEMQQQKAFETAMRQQMGMAAGASPSARAFARRGAASNVGQLQADAARQAAILRAQEQQAALAG